MDELGGAGLASDFELGVVHVNRDDTCTVKCRRGDCAESYAAAADDGDGVVLGNASAGCDVEPDCQRLNKAELFEGEVCAVEFFSRNRNSFSEGAVALYSQRLIGGAGVGPAAEATGALTARSVGRQRYCCSFAQFVRYSAASLEDGCGYFVPKNTWKGDQRILAAEGVQVRSA